MGREREGGDERKGGGRKAGMNKEKWCDYLLFTRSR